MLEPSELWFPLFHALSLAGHTLQASGREVLSEIPKLLHVTEFLQHFLPFPYRIFAEASNLQAACSPEWL